MTGGEKQVGWMRARLIAALIALFAFSFQTYLVQTHIHGAAGHEITSQTLGGQTLGGHRAPADKDDPDDCPICQAFALSGAFVTPVILILAVALSFVGMAPALVPPGTGELLIRRHKRSRAPPHF